MLLVSLFLLVYQTPRPPRACPAGGTQDAGQAGGLGVGTESGKFQYLLDRAGDFLDVRHRQLAHMRDPKRLLLEIAVAVGDLHTHLAELAVEILHGDVPRVRYRCERQRCISFVREEREVLFRPASGELRHLSVTGEPILEPFRENAIELEVQRKHVGERRSRGVLMVLCLDVLVDLQQVEIPVQNRSPLYQMARPEYQSSFNSSMVCVILWLFSNLP